MNRKAIGLAVAAAIGATVFASAFAFAPRSCDGGFDLYVWTGIAAVVTLLALPFVARIGKSVLGSVGSALGLAVFGIAAWLAGLFASDVFVLCRLF